MTRRPTMSRRRDRFGVRTWWDAVSGGAFYTRAAAAVSFVVCVTVLAPFQLATASGGMIAVLMVAIVTWLPLMMLGVAAAAIERELPGRAARAAVVLGALALGALTRPVLNEAAWSALHGTSPGVVSPARFASNLIILLAVCSIVAITTRSLRANERSRARLGAALRALADARAKLDRVERDSRERIDGVVTTLREQRDEMLDDRIDFPAVRRYSDHVRRISHHLEDRAQLDLRVVVAEDDESRPPRAQRERPPLLARLRPSPVGLVGLVFLLCSLPYLCGLPSFQGALGAVALAAPVVLGADALAHLAAARLSALGRGAALVGIWVLAGALTTTLAQALIGSAGPYPTMPLASLPAVALACAACADAIARAAQEAEQLEAVLGIVAQSLTHGARRVRNPLRHAAHMLHGRVQGRCVILAAAADERPPTEAEVETFRRDTDEAFTAIVAAFDGAEPTASGEDLSELLSTWETVLDIDAHIDPAVTEALDEPAVSARVATIVNEGFVNAVKHSVVTCVGLSIEPAGPDALRVQTWSNGILDLSGADAGRGIVSLGDQATLMQCGDEVVLEVLVPLAAPVGDPMTSPVTVVSGGAGWQGFLAPRVG